MQRHMAQDRHILGAMALTDAAVVFAKADIEDPMECIFHTPVLSDSLSEPNGITGQRGQKHALLDRDRGPCVYISLVYP